MSILDAISFSLSIVGSWIWVRWRLDAALMGLVGMLVPPVPSVAVAELTRKPLELIVENLMASALVGSLFGFQNFSPKFVPAASRGLAGFKLRWSRFFLVGSRSVTQEVNSAGRVSRVVCAPARLAWHISTHK